MVNQLTLENDILDLVMELNEAFTWEDRAEKMILDALDMIAKVRGEYANEDIEDALDTISQTWADLVAKENGLDAYGSPLYAPVMSIALEFTQSGIPEAERTRRHALVHAGGARAIVDATKEALALTPEYAAVALGYVEDILKKPTTV